MKCKIKNRNDLVDSYLAGVLSEEETEKFEEHFFNCELCFQEVKLKEELVGLIRDEGKVLFKDFLETKHAEANVVTRPKRGWFKFPQFAPVGWAYGILMLLMASGGSYWVVKNLTGDNILDEYVYDDRVPYEYMDDSFRGETTEFEDNLLLQTFNMQFRLGMSHYVVQDYAGAVETFKKLEPIVVEVWKKTNEIEVLEQARDYYFYLGVSHLALSRSKTMDDLSKGDKAEHNKKAIQYLMEAKTLTSRNGLDMFDRDSFYLGLALGFANRKQTAISEFQKIEPSSKFYNEGIKLIKKWSN